MKTIYWGLLSLWLALAGCTKGVDDEPTPAGATPATDETPFYGTIETDADTRCATKDSDGQIDVHWNPTDEIALFKGCPLCSCYGVQPDQNDPSHCELYFKEGAHGDQFGGATIEYDANYALHPYYADGVACDKVGGVPTMTFSLPATQRYNAAAHAGIGCVPMTAATRSRTETNLPFMVAVGALRLQFYTTETDPVKVTGLRFIANGDEGVAGAAAVAMNYLEEGQSGEPRLTMAADAAKEVAVDCGEGVVLSTDADYPTQFAVALPPQTFDQGFTIELTDDRGRTMEVTKPAESASPVTIVRREFYAMKAIEFKPEPEAVDLGKPANCYVVSQAGTYMFPAELVDGTAIKGSFDKVDWTWRTTGVELSDIAYVDGYIRFTVKKFVKGNASISAYDAQQHLMLYNWHIWLTDAPQEMGTVAGASSPVFLDRNIGAVATDPNDPNSYSLLYQWGRKDPYRNMAAGSINERPEINPAWKTVTGNTVYWNDWNIQNAWSSWEKRNNYPLCFMYSRTYYDGRDYNWVKYETAPTHYLWFTPKTNFDPCPAGYRIPTQQEFDVDYTLDDDGNIGFTVVADRQFNPLPAQGYLKFDGTPRFIGQEVTLWTCQPYATGAGQLGAYNFDYYIGEPSSLTNTDLVNRSFAMPVRCVKIK